MNLEGLKFLSHYITTLLHPSLIHTLPLHFIRSCNPPPSPLPLGPLPNPIAFLPLPLNDNHCLHFIVPSPPPWQPLPLPLTVFISIPSQWHSLPLPLSSFHTSKFHTSPPPILMTLSTFTFYVDTHRLHFITPPPTPSSHDTLYPHISITPFLSETLTVFMSSFQPPCPSCSSLTLVESERMVTASPCVNVWTCQREN